jgi:hypothetical protein|tara:strand:+ start:663 stop:899 length:237 start_codon:yes stop_codon:yes gene_type:complete
MELHDVVDVNSEHTIKGDTLMALRDVVVDLYTRRNLSGYGCSSIARQLDQILLEIEVNMLGNFPNTPTNAATDRRSTK